MTHFIGAVVAPSRSALDAILEPYDENKETPRYMSATRAQVIEKGREHIADYASPEGAYGRFVADPAKYVEKMTYNGKISNPDHLNYLVNEFPKKLAATDDEVYGFETYSDTDVDAEGNHYSTYNPNSLWDWWAIGGRWNGTYYPGNVVSVEQLLKDHFTVSITDWAKVPPRTLIDAEGILKRGEEGWFGYTKDDHDDETWTTMFMDRLAKSDPSLSVYFIDFHI